MAFNVNGTAMNLVYVNGVRMAVVNVDGTEVYRADNGNVTLVSQNSLTFSPGAEDVNRHFVVLTGNFSASAFATVGPVPTINGISGTTILNVRDNGGDDGGRAGIFIYKIPTGTGTFTVANVDTQGNPYFAVYRVSGISDMSTAYATAQTSAAGNFTVSAPTNGCGFVVVVKNFSGVSTITGTNADLLYVPGTPNGNPGFGANRAVTSPTHTFQGYSQVNIAATFAYDLF